MIEGLWSVNFIRPDQLTYGGGVVVFETERVFGGDTSMYYLGSYLYAAGKIKGNVVVKRHNDFLPGIFETDEITLTIVGNVTKTSIEADAFLDSDPSQSLKIEFIKLAELP